MTTIVHDQLTHLKLGETQRFKNMEVLPLFGENGAGPAYLTLKEALDQKLVTITEVHQSGSVPNLKVTNTSGQLVLLLDGEELVGAKQNRVLNTSILLKGQSETVIPVSCTEQGRWNYNSAEFGHSDLIMSHKARALKSSSVHTSLLQGRGHSTDQLRIWREIEAMHTSTGTLSTTGAMKEVYQASAEQLDQYLQAFDCLPRQRGCLVSIDGQVAGLDLISNETTYQKVHPQFIKSYAMEAILSGGGEAGASLPDQAQTFLQAAGQGQESRFNTVGLGYDCRLDHPEVMGSALIYGEQVIHLALFRKQEAEG